MSTARCFVSIDVHVILFFRASGQTFDIICFRCPGMQEDRVSSGRSDPSASRLAPRTVPHVTKQKRGLTAEAPLVNQSS